MINRSKSKFKYDIAPYELLASKRFQHIRAPLLSLYERMSLNYEKISGAVKVVRQYKQLKRRIPRNAYSLEIVRRFPFQTAAKWSDENRSVRWVYSWKPYRAKKD